MLVWAATFNFVHFERLHLFLTNSIFIQAEVEGEGPVSSRSRPGMCDGHGAGNPLSSVLTSGFIHKSCDQE